MTVFDVFLNDRRLCRAGVGADGVLNAIVNWVKLTGAAARAARRMKRPREEMWLQVGGLRRETHLRWSQRSLRSGDRITIVIASANRADPPKRRTHQSARQRQAQERRYYLHLKEKYEGASTALARNRKRKSLNRRAKNQRRRRGRV